MNGPKQWLEEGAPDNVARLLSAARSEEPTHDSLSRALAAVAAGTSVAGVAGASSAATGITTSGAVKASTLAGTAAIKWLLLGAGVGSAFVAVGMGGTSARPRPALTASPIAPIAASAQRRSAPITTAITAAPVPAVPETVTNAVAPPARAVTNAAPRTEPTPSDTRIDKERLAEEVRLIDRANDSLASGRSADTLAALDSYDARFPERRFAPEALYLRMEALLRSGRSADARQVAERLVSSYSASPQAARARRVLSETIP